VSVLFSLIDAGLAFGAHPLLDGAAFTLTAGERLGLIGRNGTGKSSLLNVIAGRIQLDDGRAVVRDGLRIVLVEQEPVLPPAGTLFESLLARGTAAGLVDERDERRYWALQARLRAELDRFGVDPEVDPEGLSGGQNKRAALALAFALEPDLLLLDEPTNHLDIEAIEALEAIVNAGPAAIIITHDRRFLDQVATRIIELDRGLVRSFPGNFATYEKVRGEQLEAEAVANRPRGGRPPQRGWRAAAGGTARGTGRPARAHWPDPAGGGCGRALRQAGLRDPSGRHQPRRALPGARPGPHHHAR